LEGEDKISGKYFSQPPPPPHHHSLSHSIENVVLFNELRKAKKQWLEIVVMK
jgi:hypothetical protein